MSEPKMLRISDACLVLVDIQERLLPAMHESARVLQQASTILKAAQILQVPVIVTEQYRKGLGATHPELATAFAGLQPLEKLEFSAWRAKGFADALQSLRRRQVLLAGIESHVCVLQTCLDLLQKGFEVYVLADAVSSRTEPNAALGLERMRAAGATIASTEMVIFEMLGKAGTPEFKAILALVK